MQDKDQLSYRERAKQHLRKHRVVYLVGGAFCVGMIVRGLTNSSEVNSEIVQKITQLGFRNEANPTIINLIERSTPSKPVHLVGTERYFDSLSDAARKTGHALSRISKNANGHIPDVNGDVFEFLKPVDHA